MANTTLQLRKSGETGNVPPSLAYGELALNYADGKLFYKAANGTITYIQSGGGGGSSSNSFATINVDSSLILATSPTDTLSFVAGNNVTISACTISKTITINSTATGGDSVDSYARSTANSASANTIIIQGVDLEQNSAISIIQGVDLAQNTTITEINQYAAGAYSTANTNATNITSVNGFAVSAYNQANSSTLLAQSAYDTANLKFNTSGGTITGNVTISANSNLTVTGNLTVLGTTTTVNTNLLEVNDPMILLAAGNFYSDVLDIGFAGSYNNGANAHTGLFRDAAGNKDWYFFEGYTPEVSGNNNINIADASFRTSNVNVNYLKGNLIATTAVVNTANVQQLNIAGSAFINTNRTITYYGTTHNQLGSGLGTRDINLTLGNFVSATVAGVTTWTFSNPIASPAVTGFILELTNGGSAALTWPASVKWPSGTAPSLTAAGVDVLTFFTDDGGTTYRGVVSMLDSK
jgi:hypothetical protein